MCTLAFAQIYKYVLILCTSLLCSWPNVFCTFCILRLQVVELQTGSSIYVDNQALRSIEAGAKTPTAMARGLLTAVFTRQVLLTCFIRGQKAKGLHNPAVQRQPLHAAAIDAILGNFFFSVHPFHKGCTKVWAKGL